MELGRLFSGKHIGVGTAALEESPVFVCAIPVFDGGISHFNGHLVHGNRAPFSQQDFIKQPILGENGGHHSHEGTYGSCEKSRDKGGLKLDPAVANLTESFDLLPVMDADSFGSGQDKGLEIFRAHDSSQAGPGCDAALVSGYA